MHLSVQQHISLPIGPASIGDGVTPPAGSSAHSHTGHCSTDGPSFRPRGLANKARLGELRGGSDAAAHGGAGGGMSFCLSNSLPIVPLLIHSSAPACGNYLPELPERGLRVQGERPLPSRLANTRPRKMTTAAHAPCGLPTGARGSEGGAPAF